MEIEVSSLLDLIRIDGLSIIMTALILSVAVIIYRYSANYLAGDGSRRRFTRWFLLVILCVLVLVTSNHLLLMALAWIGTSLSLHRLLVFFPERPAAALAAHKKFLISRLGDVFIVSGFLLIGKHFGSYRLDVILDAAHNHVVEPTTTVTIGALFLASAAILKCAQLPFHGWLIQVMEAPTPVSALLHAGVINLGGFLMIRFSPVVGDVQAAQWLLIVFGTVTAIVASLIMMTRVSIKVMLAWSTCAQMGFMLLECGLGAYSLALLHLVAHSLYKAWAFLGSGRTVEEAVRRLSVTFDTKERIWNWLIALPIAGVLVGIMVVLFRIDVVEEHSLAALAGVLAIALATFLAEGLSSGEKRIWFFLPAASFAIGGLYFMWHHLFTVSVGSLVSHVELTYAASGFVLGAFLLNYAMVALIRLRPRNQFVRRLHDYMYHGLYLDELFTYVTLKIWPLSR